MASKLLGTELILKTVGTQFLKIKEHRAKNGNIKISMQDAAMSGLAVFILKFPSLLQFNNARDSLLIKNNLRNLFGIKEVPSDTQLRDILDLVGPKSFEKAYSAVHGALRQSGKLEEFKFLGYYCTAIDGTQNFASTDVSCPYCLKKEHKNDDTSYHHQLLGASIVSPKIAQVIPLFPEAIVHQDGSKKNDCELNAAKRFLPNLKRLHPHMPFLILQDAIGANSVNINLILEQGFQYIINAKPTALNYLFDQFHFNRHHSLTESYESSTIIGVKVKKKVTYHYQWLNQVELVKSSPLKTNLLVYRETIEYCDPSQDKRKVGTQVTNYSWITGLTIEQANVNDIMLAGRRRWAIENETFQTLKQETLYNLEHNYGHGKLHLCTNFAVLAVLAFLIDQAREIGCVRFKKALSLKTSRLLFWQTVRFYSREIWIKSWEQLHQFLCREKNLGGEENTC
jgi:hypothetical protein